jgi:DNA-binding NarL/FixJ family response regulator
MESHAAPINSGRAVTPRGNNLTPGQAREIAESIAAGERQAEIAARFGISAQTVRAIKSGKRWSDAIDETLRTRMATTPSAAGVLDASDVQRVMVALEAGRAGNSIAEEFGISPSMVSAIKHGRAWSALDPGLASRLATKPRAGKALVAEQVAEIKQRLFEGQSSRKIAEEFGVSASTIQAISQGRTWADVAPGARTRANP